MCLYKLKLIVKSEIYTMIQNKILLGNNHAEWSKAKKMVLRNLNMFLLMSGFQNPLSNIPFCGRVLTIALDFTQNFKSLLTSSRELHADWTGTLFPPPFCCTASVLLSNQDVFHGTLTISCLTSTLPELFIKVNLTCDTSMHFIFAEKQICAWHQQRQPVFYIEHDLMPRDPQGPTRQHWAPQTVMYKLI